MLPQRQDEAADEAWARLRLGDVSGEWPSSWEFFQLAAAGDLDEARELLQGDDPLTRYNRFVLQPDLAEYEELLVRLPSPLREMLVVTAFTSGITNELPATAALEGAWLAMALSVTAAAALERQEFQVAIEVLGQAAAAARADSPLFAAQLLGQHAELLRQDPQLVAMATQCYREALALVEGTPLVTLPAELWIQLGETYHQQAGTRRGPLMEAVKCYQSGIQCGLTREEHPQHFAHAQLQIGLAYLAAPLQSSSDQLRMAIALQSFREAAKVYTKEAFPQLWATTQLNLANAFQYLPSSHPQENLIEAVKIYDDVLTVRDRATDPLGYARVLLNQSNALAHLGMFRPALEKLT
ncbi:MAG: hypothetical protein AAGF97_05045, partial [Planctomycetota bacterium]